MTVSCARAQEYSPLLDSLLRLALDNRIPVLNKDGKPMDGQFIPLYTEDTVVNDQWTRPKYRNNVFYDAFDGVKVRRWFDLDTMNSSAQPGYRAIVHPVKDWDGNFIRLDTVCLLPKYVKPHHRKPKLPAFAVTGKKRAWQNAEVIIAGDTVTNDSCVLLYRLQMFKDGAFYQYYGPDSTYCAFPQMEPFTEVGVEGDDRILTLGYYLQGHFLSPAKGTWRVTSGKLVLRNEARLPVTVFEILSSSRRELRLQVVGRDQQVLLKKSALKGGHIKK